MAFKKRAIPNAVRRMVCRRAGAEIGLTVTVRCHYCDTVGTIEWRPESSYWPIVDGLEFDHVTAESTGGQSEPDNLVLACRPCNRKKGPKPWPVNSHPSS